MWLKLDDQFHEHPKLRAVGPEAAWLHIGAMCLSARFLTDGFIAESDIPLLAPTTPSRTRNKFVSKLLELGLWERANGGYQIHDWLDYQPSADSVRTEREKARERMRDRRGRSPEHPPNDQGTFERSSPSPSRPVPSETPGEPDPPGSVIDQVAAVLREDSPEAADEHAPRPAELGLLEAVLNHDQAYLMSQVIAELPAFADVAPGAVERLKRQHGSPALTEALRRLIASLPDHADHPTAYLERLVADAAAEGLTA